MAPTLSIDDSVFKTKPTLTLEQFVFYDALQIQWTDDIITPGFIGHDLCGGLSHEIWTEDSGSTQNLDITVFP